METKGTLPRTRKLPPRNGKITSETLNFRKVARQVMLANMFTRRRQLHDVKTVSSSKNTTAGHRVPAKRERIHNNSATEKPPMKRRGTPELFPMSEEMKQTVISLGRLDLLPEERKARGNSFGEESQVEKSRVSGKFREKTRRRIIQPQRFIRNVQSSIINSKKILEDREEIEHDDISTENNTRKTTPENATNCGTNSTDESDGVLIRTKPNCNILTRPQTGTHSYCTKKPAKNQHYSFNNKRPFYETRVSDLGPFSAQRPKMTPAGTWPTNAFDSTRMRTRANYFPNISRRNTFTGKAWAGHSVSTESDNTNHDETLKTRRWKSVESLTREIEEKCLTWLENRYGLPPY